MDAQEEKPMNSPDECEAVRKKEEPKDERRRRLLKQFGLVCLAASGHFALGATLPWPSPALSSMAENNSTLVGTEITLTPAQMDMTGSLVSLGSLVGAWVAGWMVSVLGRRRSLQVISVPYLLGWLCNALSPNAPVLLTARFVLGLACGATTVAASSYIMESSRTRECAGHDVHDAHAGHRAGKPIHCMDGLRVPVALLGPGVCGATRLAPGGHVRPSRLPVLPGGARPPPNRHGHLEEAEG
nr:sugar transporter ERD6-like [Penaeus vannamei]